MIKIKIFLPIISIVIFMPFMVNAESKSLYDVLKDAAEEGTNAKEYTGEHQDSMDPSLSVEKIYTWHEISIERSDEVLNKNNVIFANHCWKMIRTTDTGGVKLIYFGEIEDGKCRLNRGQHVGYGIRTKDTLSSSYYYGTSYTYDSTTKTFKLFGDITTGAVQTGKYTCKATSSDETCEILYYVDTLSSGTSYYVLPLNSNS